MAKKNKKKAIEPTKSRKVVRKEKRQQKKQNRAFFQKKRKELKIEYQAKLKQNQKNNSSKKGKAEVSKKQIGVKNEHLKKDNELDEEIESDFELSDEELETKTELISKKRNTSKAEPMTQMEADRERLRKQEQALRKDMSKQRVRQLKVANEEEDKTIRKLEKLLKIDKTKGRKKIPKMFNDGLDYALEMCLPENIEKMYEAAKEAASLDHLDTDWQEDFELVTGKSAEKQTGTKAKKAVVSNSTQSKGETSKTLKNKTDSKKIARLRQVERKYFADSDFESDLSDFDSEFEDDSLGKTNQEKQNSEDEGEGYDYDVADDFDGTDDGNGEQSDEEDSVKEDFEVEDDDEEDEAPEEVTTMMKCSSKRKLEREENSKKSLKAEPKVKKQKHLQYDSEEASDYSESDDDEEMDDGLDDILEGLDDDINDRNPSKASKTVEAVDSEVEESFHSENELDEKNAKEEKPDIWEDIYGRKRDKQGNVITGSCDKYIPPHMRARLTQTNEPETKLNAQQLEKLQRLKKLLKGYMNRLSEANMHKISTDIDALYMKNSRNDMNNTLSTLICDALVTNVLAPERMVIEHAMLVAVLHANIGTEVGAHFLQTLIDKLMLMLNMGIEQHPVEDKTLDNILFVLCHMYTFRIFSHSLIYEILNVVAKNLCEKSVECLLLALRSVGFALRKDDPAALKELILTLQRKSGEAPDELKNNTRLKYMLDVLLAIKNNNVNKIPQYDPSVAEHLRKILKTLLVNGKYVTTLNITLDDLLNVDKRGKWWVVGSAWTGNINDIGAASKSITKSSRKEEQKFSQQLLELARKQRMNTDDRRNIFCIIMSAEDYVDAFEKLLHLAIKDHRIIISVIQHCCLSEKTFNMYYAVLTKRFCEYDRKYQLAVQFTIWDRIRDIATSSTIQSRNLAQYISYLISHGAIPISVLKIIEFGALDKLTMRLVRQILLSILLGDEELCKQVFQRVAPSAKLKTFKDSIRLFMHHFLAKGLSKESENSEQKQLLKKRLKTVDGILTSSIFED